MADTNPLVGVLDQVIGFMEDALLVKEADETRINELLTASKKAKADQEKVILEKVAKAKEGFFDRDAMTTCLQKMTNLGVISEEGATKIANRVTSEPNAVWPLMVKIAERLLTAPGEGAGVEREMSAEDSDPDGWLAMAKGHKVAIRR